MFEEDEVSLASFLVQQTVVPIVGLVAVLIPNRRCFSVFSMPNLDPGQRQILADYPSLEREDILAAIDYAAHQADHAVLLKP